MPKPYLASFFFMGGKSVTDLPLRNQDLDIVNSIMMILLITIVNIQTLHYVIEIFNNDVVLLDLFCMLLVNIVLTCTYIRTLLLRP